MEYNQLQSGQYFECKIKCTYVEIYIYNPRENKYDFAFSLQKKDFDGILGYGETASSLAAHLVPITLSDSAIITILQKARNNGVGIVDLESEFKKGGSGLDIVDVDYVVTVDPNTNPYDNSTDTDVEVENESEYDILSSIDDGVVYVNPKAIDCTVINEEEVEVEEIVEEVVNDKPKKDYSKLIWLALAAAAALM